MEHPTNRHLLLLHQHQKTKRRISHMLSRSGIEDIRIAGTNEQAQFYPCDPVAMPRAFSRIVSVVGIVLWMLGDRSRRSELSKEDVCWERRYAHVRISGV